LFNSAIRQKTRIQNIKFLCKNYIDLDIKGSKNIIYYDIPYKNTEDYAINFDYEKFYSWAIDKAKNNYVFISEYKMPASFKCIWEKEIMMGLDSASNKERRIEKLFVVK